MMAGLPFLLLSAGGLPMVCCGLAATLRRRLRLGLWLYIACNGTVAAGAVIGRSWPLAAGNLAVVIVAAWMLWHLRRRRKRAPRAYGAKSLARIAALTRRARETARPRPVRRPAPQGG
jgi:hypothetical protein